MNKLYAALVALSPLVAVAYPVHFEYQGKIVTLELTNSDQVQEIRFAQRHMSQAAGVMESGDRDWLAEACTTYVPKWGEEYEDSESAERRDEILAKVLDRENFTKPLKIKLLSLPTADVAFKKSLAEHLLQRGLPDLTSKFANISEVEVTGVSVEYGRKSLVKIFRGESFKEDFSKLVSGKKITWSQAQDLKIAAHGLDFLCDLRNGNIRLEFDLRVVEAPQEYRKVWLKPIQVKWLIENLSRQNSTLRESDKPVLRGRRLAQLVDQYPALKNTPKLLAKVMEKQDSLYGGDLSQANVQAMSDLFVDQESKEFNYKGVSVLREVTFE
ncbi:MAG TPA: hypothetical protein VM901_07370 [Bdellovibrionota bacterium]|jgi:hypothetical protein|nr:hypothetical protein [Bdellovibrionota bacterium]